LYDGRYLALFAGFIHYWDIFPRTPAHTTKYCYELRGIEGPNNTIKPSYRLCPYWNCTDDECSADHREYRKSVERIFQGAKKEIPADWLKPDLLPDR
jgi:hypothetical protein